MAITPYLAMTAAEFRDAASLPPRPAWMACHFSHYSRGLSNLPRELPADTMLIVNDITPFRSHDPEVIVRQLAQCVERCRCSSLLLDFQRHHESYPDLIKGLLDALPCPVAVSDTCDQNYSCPVFLKPCPPHTPLEEYLAPWKGRALWLEAAMSSETICLAETGCCVDTAGVNIAENGFCDIPLHCHYSIEPSSREAAFHLWRTRDDLASLLEEAEQLGVTQAVGLYQELGI